MRHLALALIFALGTAGYGGPGPAAPPHPSDPCPNVPAGCFSG